MTRNYIHDLLNALGFVGGTAGGAWRRAFAAFLQGGRCAA